MLLINFACQPAVKQDYINHSSLCIHSIFNIINVPVVPFSILNPLLSSPLLSFFLVCLDTSLSLTVDGPKDRVSPISRQNLRLHLHFHLHLPLKTDHRHHHHHQKTTMEALERNGELETHGRDDDAGAAFVLESKGSWWHAGFHLTTAIVGPTILTLPYAFRGMGWSLGLMSLTLTGAVTFYSYFLMSKVLDHCEKEGRRHIRFRELAADVLGSGWMFYFVICVQTAVNTGVTVGCILLSGECLQIMYSSLYPDGPIKLYQFIALVTVVMILLSQLPTFHSLRHISLASLVLSLGYTFLVVIACIRAGHSRNAPHKDYTLDPHKSTRAFDAFASISILASLFGNGILPEIQATVAPPVTGKMFRGLVLCYSVIIVTFYSAAVSGYWAFGNKSSSNILNSLMPDKGPSLAPTWLLGLAVVFVLLQLFAIGLVYSQVAYEIMEKKSADVKQGMFSKRNLVPRLFLRTIYMVLCAFVAAMLPFFGDINGVVGAIGFIPLDFILPMLLYNMTHNPSRTSVTFWLNISIIVVFTGTGIMGAFSSVRKLVLDAHKFKLFSSDMVD